MEILVLVCLMSVSQPDCQKATAVANVYAPEPANSMSGCLTTEMLFAAESNLVTKGTYAKIVCIPPHASVVAQKQPAERVSRY
jgi:hypothetical protein